MEQKLKDEEITKLKAENAQLKAENAQLKEENDQLQSLNDGLSVAFTDMSSSGNR